MEELDCDICLLAETMTRSVKLEGCRCITARKSVGQNMCIVLRNSLTNNTVLKLYEPNEIANMMGIRIELVNTNLRVYTAHLKQQSANSRDDIREQFEEVHKQFQYANDSKEGIIMAFDSNVHVGGDVITGCPDVQDWGGKLLMDIVKEENLTLVNATDKCSGIITRVDPRNGNVSTIDLVICNLYAMDSLKSMDVDEEGTYKPTNYAKVVKKTDHNTIMLKIQVEKCKKTKPIPFINTNNEDERINFIKLIEEANITDLFADSNCDLNIEFSRMMQIWKDSMDCAFHKITPKRNQKSGITKEVRELIKKEKWIRDNVLQNPERGRQIAEITSLITAEIERSRAIKIEAAVESIENSKNPQSEIFKNQEDEKES